MKIQLPIDEALDRITKAFSEKQNLILSAAPGAGKTTRVPVALLAHTPKKILMLQPRRIAARAAAERIAQENQWTLGREVGYRVRFEDKSQDTTRLLIVTEALLMRELLRDPQLSDFGVIILDEFHERNLYSDAGLAAVRELQQLERPDLKILVMSATLNPAPLLEFLAPAAFEEVEGRVYPVEVHYESQSQTLNTDRNFIERVVQKTIEASQTGAPEFPILVFLPGLSEIQRVQDALNQKLSFLQHKTILPLHGSLQLSAQHEVLESQKPKIILCTNIAETSLTIDGVRTVIDSGLARELQNDQRRLYPWLKTTRISRASAEQRKGRAGRTGPGRCFRLWNKLDEQSMPAFGTPDIQTQELSELLMILFQLGIGDPKNFGWFEKPPVLALERSIQFLNDLGLIAKENGGNKSGDKESSQRESGSFQLTRRGQWIQKMPLPPRLGSLLFEGVEQNKIQLAAQMASLLNEKDPWSREDLDSWGPSAKDSDLIPRLQTLNQSQTPREFQLPVQLTRHLLQLLKVPFKPNDKISGHEVNKLLAIPFQDRLARRRRPKEKSALVVGQKGVELSPRSLVRAGEFFFCLSGHAHENNGNAIVDLAHPISKNEIFDHFQNQISLKKDLTYQEDKQIWIASEQKVFKDLPLEEPTTKPVQFTAEQLVEVIKASFEKWKLEDLELQQFYRRLDWAQQLWPHEPWPPLSLWEEESIELACLGEKSVSAVRQKNWEELFLLALPPSMQKLLVEELPHSMKVPNGRRFPLHYETSGLVTLEIKIQEAFGWKETPKIAEGKIKVRLSLLGPHKRPLQTTDDLESFWKGTYLDLRPQLKARYPKHSWPEDPMSLS